MVQKIIVNQKRQRTHSKFRAHHEALNDGFNYVQRKAHQAHNDYTRDMLEEIGEF